MKYVIEWALQQKLPRASLRCNPALRMVVIVTGYTLFVPSQH